MTPDGVNKGLLLLCCFICSGTDIFKKKIYNTVLLFFFTTAVIEKILFHESLLDGTLGLLCGLLLFFPLYGMHLLGAGDVKQLAVMGCYVGWKDCMHISLLSLYALTCIQGIRFLFSGKLLKLIHQVLWQLATNQASGGNHPLLQQKTLCAFSPFLLLATVLILGMKKNLFLSLIPWLQPFFPFTL